MKLFFITTNYTIYLSLVLLVSTSTLAAQESQQVQLPQHKSAQITQTNIQLTNQQVAITWMTQGETDLDLFIVQRSLDGKQWEQLIAIAAAGNTEHQQIYQTTDSTPYEGTSYYRVGQLDYDGRERYTEVVEVNYEVAIERFFSAQHSGGMIKYE